jgi:hypothetical protein
MQVVLAEAEPSGLIVRLAPRPPGALAALAVPPGTRLGNQVSSSSVFRLKVTDGKPLKDKLSEVKAWPGVQIISQVAGACIWTPLALGSFGGVEYPPLDLEEDGSSTSVRRESPRASCQAPCTSTATRMQHRHSILKPQLGLLWLQAYSGWKLIGLSGPRGSQTIPTTSVVRPRSTGKASIWNQ